MNRLLTVEPLLTTLYSFSSAGAVGINLTQANRVFLMEPCFNPALEQQAIGRVHRLGQTRRVDIVRLVMERSVETRINAMLDQKYGTGPISAESNGEEEDKKPAAVLATPITVGCIQTDKAAVMEDSFDLLFGFNSADI